jgi:hypothetical protein
MFKPPNEDGNISFSLDGKMDIENSFELPLITPDKVLKILQEIPANKATGADKLGPTVLKIAAPGIASVLARLINHCIQKSNFPISWKTAKVTPVYKRQGEKSDKHNYRPISVLSILSKIYERHIYDSLYTYLSVNNLLYGLQSGFRRSHSIESALIRLVDQLLFELDQDKVSGLLCVDYSKAFDLINHDILIAKLKIFGIDGKDLQLFKSYLADRRQYVSVKGTESSMREIKYGVPQGRILGPLLFLVFISDLPSAIPNSTVDIYADDTTCSSSSHYLLGVTELQSNLQLDVDCLYEWSLQNHMVLNTDKTKSILVSGKRLRSRLDNSTLDLQLNGTTIGQVTSKKLLGVRPTLDEELSFREHVEKLCKKLSKKIGLLKKIRSYLATITGKKALL